MILSGSLVLRNKQHLVGIILLHGLLTSASKPVISLHRVTISDSELMLLDFNQKWEDMTNGTELMLLDFNQKWEDMTNGTCLYMGAGLSASGSTPCCNKLSDKLLLLRSNGALY